MKEHSRMDLGSGLLESVQRSRLPAMRATLLPLLLNILAAGIVVHIGYVLSNRLTFSGFSYDENWFVWSGWSLLKGAVPYKDFHAFKPPMVYLTNAAGIALFGLHDLRFRLIFQALAVGSLTTLFAAMLRRGVDRLVAVSITILLSSLYFDPYVHDLSLNDAESIGLAYYFFGIACLMWPTKRRWVSDSLGGAMLAACVLSKEPFALVVGPTWLAFAFDEEHDIHRRGVIAYVARTLAGAGLVVGTTLVHLFVSGAWSAYVRLLEQYVPFAQSYCTLLGRFVPSTFIAEQRQNWGHLISEFRVLPQLGFFIPLFVAAFATVTRDRALHLTTCALAFVGACYTTFIGHCYWRHYYLMAFSGVALLAIVGAVGLGRLVDRKQNFLQRGVHFAFAVCVCCFVFPRYYAEKNAHHHAPLYGGVPADLVDFVRTNSGKDDYMLTMGAPGIYIYADRRSPDASNTFVDELLMLYPGQTDEERLTPLRVRLTETMPKIVIIDPQWQQRGQRFLKNGILPFLAENNYREQRPQIWVHPRGK